VGLENHFAELAPTYDEVRLTDIAPVFSIRRRLNNRRVKGIDVGCGNGRYTRLLVKFIGRKLTIIGADSSREMLVEMTNRSNGHRVLQASAESLPLKDGEYEFITTFNAVHHFDIAGFLDEAHRLLKPGELLFIYTRTPEQNTQTIWGRCFPLFCEFEDRLFTKKGLLSLALEHKFEIVNVEDYVYTRFSSPQELLRKARSFHYSTFRLIPEHLFETCMVKFERNLAEITMDSGLVTWFDSNVLYTLRK